jgi:hypothetical protein
MCGECCEAAPCHWAADLVPYIDPTWTEDSGETCPALGRTNPMGQRRCTLYDEIMRIPGIDDGDGVFAPGCCLDRDALPTVSSRPRSE